LDVHSFHSNSFCSLWRRSHWSWCSINPR
jgi:hypothetical protein